MSLRDELPKTSPDLGNSVALNKALSAEIEAQTAEFLKNGGKITGASSGETSTEGMGLECFLIKKAGAIATKRRAAK